MRRSLLLLLMAWALAACGSTPPDETNGDDVTGDLDADTTVDGAADSAADSAETNDGAETTACVEGAACEDGDPCTTGESCKDGTCSGGGAKDCDDGSPCTVDTCGAATGGCSHTPVADDPATPCDDGDGCSSGDRCLKGACLPTAVTSCDDSNPCTTDTCGEGGGCGHVDDAALAGKVGGCEDGDACTAGDTCKGGVCLAGAATSCDDDNVCTADSCDAAKGCVHAATDEAGKACDDGDACTLGDHCIGALCIPDAVTSCDDANPCTDDTCSADGCVSLPVAATTSCDDGDACTSGDACKAGACSGAGKTCDDDNPCTDDTCAVATGACGHTPVKGADGKPVPCDDGDACTGPDACAGALCLAGPATSCDDANPCTNDVCGATTGCSHAPNTLPCDDGDLCTFLEVCKDGACTAGKAKTCVDGLPCTGDACDPKTGACTFAKLTATAAAPAPCDDGDVCTKDEACKDGLCQGGKPGGCDDGNACTFDACDAGKGCLNVETAAPCDDGDACTKGDQCVKGVCKILSTVSCDDGKVCTDDSCDKSNGKCAVTAKADGTTCDDGNPCTTGETCAAAACKAPTPKTEVLTRVSKVAWANLPAVAVGDIDGDKDVDIVGALKGDKPGQLPNVGVAKGGAGASFGAVTQLTGWTDGSRCATSPPTPRLLLADVDGDGDLDLILGGVSHKACTGGALTAELVHVAENSAGTFGKPVAVHSFGTLEAATDWQHAIGLAWGRFSDAKTHQLAVAVATKKTGPFGPVTSREIRVLTPTVTGGGLTWSSWATAPATQIPTQQNEDGSALLLHVADLDGDQIDEILVDQRSDTNGGVGLVLVHGATAGTFTAKLTSATSGKQVAGRISPADVDGDGDVDLVIQRHVDADGKESFKEPAQLFRNDGTATWWLASGLQPEPFVEASTGANAGLQIVEGVHDLDGDGVADAYGLVAEAGSETARAAAWLISGGGTKAVQQLAAPTDLSESNVVGAFDLDGDGKVEFVALSESRVVAGSVHRHGCTDGNVCTVEACDLAKGCTSTDAAAACDDGSACTVDDACAKGSCQAGDAMSCDDNNACTDDACDPKAGCTHSNNSAPCSVGGCSATCDSGSCPVSPAQEVCDDKDNDCNGQVDEVCVDGDGDGYCVSNVQVVGKPKACTAGGGDCKDSDASITPDALEVCGDGIDNNCNQAVDETCTCGDGVVSGTLGEQCDDGNADDTDACTSQCVNAACGDGFVHAGQEQCDDGNATNGDGCANDCTKEPTCGDGTCNGTEKCHTCPQDCGACKDVDGDGFTSDKDCDDADSKVYPGATEVCDGKDNDCDGAKDNGAPCDDGNACTNDACDAKTGSCSNVANTGSCNDGDACTTNDACANKACGGTAKVCDDGDPCTVDACDAQSGSCKSPAKDCGSGKTCSTATATAGQCVAVCGATTALATGGSVSFVIRSGTLWAWGDNTNGRLGLGDTNPRVDETQVGKDTDWAMVSSAGQHAAAIKADGSLWTWGNGANGRLGHGDLLQQTTPKQVGSGKDWAVVSVGNDHTAAIKKDGTLWAWGGWSAGQRCGATADATTPTQIGGDKDWSTASPYVLSANFSNTMVIKTDGSLWGCGQNEFGSLGVGHTSKVTTMTREATSGTGFAQITSHRLVSSAIKTNGTLWTTGQSDYGRLARLCFPVPCNKFGQEAGGSTDWKRVAVGGFHLNLLKTNGDVWSVGSDEGGVLWRGFIATSTSLVKAPGGGVADVGSWYYSAVALKSDGTRWGAGSNGATSVLGLGNTLAGVQGDLSTKGKATSTPTLTCVTTPCSSAPCKNGGSCAVSGSSFVCTCAGSYSGLTCEDPKPSDWQAGPNLQAGSRTQAELVKLKDGRVLVIGGLSGGAQTKTAEVFNPAGSGSMTLVSNDLATPRRRTASVLLADGRVLVTHGDAAGNVVLPDVRIYDPQSNSFDGGTDTGIKRLFHTATALNDGRVLIAGGSFGVGVSPQNSATLFKPSDKTFATIPIGGARQDHAATLLGNGKVLLAGGRPNATSWYTGGVVFDPSNDSVTNVDGDIGKRNLPFVFTLPGGKVLISGGGIEDTFALYDPATNKATLHSGADGIRNSWEASATQLKDGRVLVAGGKIGGVQTASTRIYDPQTNAFSDGPNLKVAVRNHGAVRILDGRVLFVGGSLASNAATNATQIFDPAANTITSSANLAQTRIQFTPVALDNGGAFLAGGYNGGYLNSTAVFK